jgi:N-[(2S)-2-amino-2-carboxyethyl]-L-glutamate dehydrogenase
MNNDLLMLKGNEIIEILKNKEVEIINCIKKAYQAHSEGLSTLPYSVFLRLQENSKDRIIALPAYLGGEFDTAGIKWIASFPDNLQNHLERASAVLILNSTKTGYPKAIMESSIISAYRTAASAALAADILAGPRIIDSLGLIGCGLINFETLRFILAIRPTITDVLIYDLSHERSEQFRQKCMQLPNKIKVIISDNVSTILKTDIIAIATTATKPYIFDISNCSISTIILHTSLRDLAPEIILSCNNIVDDIDHVCRAQTSIHLAETKTGNREFISWTIGDILNQNKKIDHNKIIVFSPFGLGILDLALGMLVYKTAVENNQGTYIDSFFPLLWTDRAI